MLQFIVFKNIFNTRTTGGGGSVWPPCHKLCHYSHYSNSEGLKFWYNYFFLFPCCSKQFEPKMLSIKSKNETFSEVTKRKIMHKKKLFSQKIWMFDNFLNQILMPWTNIINNSCSYIIHELSCQISSHLDQY